MNLADYAYKAVVVSVAGSPATSGQDPTAISGAVVCGSADEYSFDRAHESELIRDNNSTVSCDPGTSGRYVHVSRNGAYLQIMEVEVYATESGELVR